MRKLPPELEHPLDNALVDAAHASLPVWRSLRMTHNHVTLLSIACEVAAVRCLVQRRAVSFVVFAALGVFFDYADGHYARSDDMVTRLGDLLDHVSDWTYAAAVAGVLAWRLRWGAVVPLAVLAALGGAMAVHLGCQQRVYAAEHPGASGAETLDALRCLCDGDPRARLKWTRWAGSVAVFHAALIAIAVLTM